MNPTDLPELHQALLDAEHLQRLFADIMACGELLAILPKRAPNQYIDVEDGWTPEAAQAALLSGELRGVQLRYRHEGKEWWDTVLVAPGGWRLTRIAHELQD